MEPSPWYLGRPPCGPIFYLAEKNVLLFFLTATVQDYCLTQTQTTNIFFQIHSNLVLFLLQITFILHIIHMKNIIGQFFLSKNYFWGKNLIFGVKNLFLGLKLIFWEKNVAGEFFCKNSIISIHKVLSVRYQLIFKHQIC